MVGVVSLVELPYIGEVIVGDGEAIVSIVRENDHGAEIFQAISIAVIEPL